MKDILTDEERATIENASKLKSNFPEVGKLIDIIWRLYKELRLEKVRKVKRQ